MKKLICCFALLVCVTMLWGCVDIFNGSDHYSASDDSTHDLSDNSEESSEVKDEISHQVTKDEWEKALSFEVRATKSAQHVWYPKTEQREEQFIYYDVVECDGDKIRVLDMDETLSTVRGERYYVKNGDSYTYHYKGSGSKWSVEESSQSSFESRRDDRVIGWDGEYGLVGEFSYEEFTYDENEQVYTLDKKEVEMDGEKITFYNIKLKFSDGKLEYFYLEGEIDGYNCIKTMFEYEPVEIVLPFDLT